MNHEIIFPDASLNFDDDKRFMPLGHSDYRLNVIKNEGGRHGLLTNMKGNEKMAGQLILRGSVIKVIGSCYDIKRRAIIYFIYSVDSYESYHSVIMYKLDDNTFHAILYEESVLNFHLDYPIINPLVLDDILFFTDGYNEPRALHIDKAMAHYLEYPPSVPMILTLEEGVIYG